VCVGLPAAFPSPAAAADPFGPDRELTAALEKADPKAVGALLHDQFQWVDVKGAVHTKAQTLATLAAFAASDKGNASPSELVTRDYDQVQMLRGIHNNQKFVHVWVRTPAGWRAFVYFDTAVLPERPEGGPQRPGNEAPCENPCKTVPARPANAEQKATLDTWMRIKTAEWHADADTWEALTDVDHITISETGANPRIPHIEQLREQKAAFGRANPGTPVISMQLADFGKFVVMTDLEGRDSAKPSRYCMRLFINRGDGYKICLSVHTVISGNATATVGIAPPGPPAGAL
jgi:hypothetical protein